MPSRPPSPRRAAPRSHAPPASGKRCATVCVPPPLRVGGKSLLAGVSWGPPRLAGGSWTGVPARDPRRRKGATMGEGGGYGRKATADRWVPVTLRPRMALLYGRSSARGLALTAHSCTGWLTDQSACQGGGRGNSQWWPSAGVNFDSRSNLCVPNAGGGASPVDRGGRLVPCSTVGSHVLSSMNNRLVRCKQGHTPSGPSTQSGASNVRGGLGGVLRPSAYQSRHQIGRPFQFLFSRSSLSSRPVRGPVQSGAGGAIARPPAASHDLSVDLTPTPRVTLLPAQQMRGNRLLSESAPRPPFLPQSSPPPLAPHCKKKHPFVERKTDPLPAGTARQAGRCRRVAAGVFVGVRAWPREPESLALS